MRTYKIVLSNVERIKAICNAACKCKGDVDVVSGRYTIDCKSIMGLFSLDLSKEVSVTVHNEEDFIVFEREAQKLGLMLREVA